MSILLFVCATLLGVFSLVGAFTVWLSDVVGSASLALLIVGVATSIVAAVVYFGSLRGKIVRFEQHLEMVWSVCSLVEGAYRRVVLVVKTIMGSFKS